MTALTEQPQHVDTEGDIHSRLRAVIARLEHHLPGQAPIKDFVHHNTLHGFQHLPFREALSEARRLTGARGYLPEEDFRKHFRNGRITREDLKACLIDEAALDAEEVVGTTLTDTLRRRDVYVTALLHPFRPVTANQLSWQFEELAALERLQADVPTSSRTRLLQMAARNGRPTQAEAVGDLWMACLESLELSHTFVHPEELVELSAEQAEAMLAQLESDGEAGEGRVRIDRMVRKEAVHLLETLYERVGRDWTLRSLLLALTGEDLMEGLLPPLIRQVAAHLDLGMAPWRNPEQTGGFYAAWRACAKRDYGWLFEDHPDWGLQLERLADDPATAIAQELKLLGLAESRWEGYLERLALELPGWSGMFLWRHRHAGYSGQGAPMEMVDYLAVRLIMERLFAQRICRRVWRVEASLPVLRWYLRRHPAELSVRHALFNARLPEYLTSLAQRLVADHQENGEDALDETWQATAQMIWIWRQSPAADRPVGLSVFRSAWPLFRLAQHLGLCGAELRALGREGAGILLDCLVRLDEERAGFIWLSAYERHYREQIFGALLANHGRGERNAPAQAQLVFCMDDREEGMRRHLEGINPALETLGAAGFFGVSLNWRGLDDATVTPLCPVVVTPSHEIREIPRRGEEALFRMHETRRRRRLRWQDCLHQDTRHRLLSAAVITAAAGIAAPFVLAGKILLPAALTRWSQRLRDAFDRRVASRLTLTAPADGRVAAPEQPRIGFTDEEQAERVADFLRTIGLTSGFAPLVVLMGHGSHSQNNPHRAAYDCGACSGRHGGPNARVFAAMANRASVRALVAGRGIGIPSGTWFIGAEHDTCDDRVVWYDEEDVPVERREALRKLQGELTEAGRRHARERCRRFASAPLGLDHRRAWRHVARRAADFSQPRPELGHAMNATAFIGRRAMSRGTFFDRRAFLISYNPIQDPDGEVLEATLLAVGPVGAGISLEYYFSTVDNERYGCGTKVVHNVTGLFGVMEGASSDLRTGLPRQMIEIHEAMRLLIVVEHTTEVLTRIYQRQPPLQELVGKGWVLLAVKEPDAPVIHLFDPDRGWRRWQGDGEAVPEVASSTDWYSGRRDPLPPVLIRQPGAGGPV